MSARPTGYEPLYTLKEVAPELWIADGGWISFYGMPFPTRMTVVRLPDGGLWVHSPVALEGTLQAELAALGPVRHLVAPNWIHYAWIAPWQVTFPEAEAWAAPGVRERARAYGVEVRFDHDLADGLPEAWGGALEALYVPGSTLHHEVVFFHHPSRSLILTDLIESFEAEHVAPCLRPVVALAGVRYPDGKAPIDMRWSFRNGRSEARKAVRQMLAWRPERVLLAHGRWYPERGEEALRRAFRWLDLDA